MTAEVQQEASEAWALQRQYMGESVAALARVATACEATAAAVAQQNLLLERVATGLGDAADKVAAGNTTLSGLSNTAAEISCAASASARSSESAEKHLYRIKGQGKGLGKWH